MSAPLTFHLLGGASISDGDNLLTGLGSRTAEALLIYLACHDRPLSRQFLADFFWDDRSQSQAAANLRSILSTLRKQTGDHLLIDRQTIAFDHQAPHHLDSAEFESQIRQLQPHLNQPTPLDQETAGALEAALSHYQGDFLAGFHLNESRGFEEWILVTRERLRRLAVIGLRRLVQYHLANGRFQSGLTFAGRLIEADPYNEEAQRFQMWLLVRSGSRNAAVQSFQAFHDLLAADLSVEPAPATTAVYEKISRLPFPPPNNLSPSDGPFIGRETEIKELQADLVQPHCRLITIVGPGGVGKTTLATHIGRQMAGYQPGYFLDGVWFVPLAPVQSAQFMVTTLARILGLTFKGSATPREQLLAYLQEREMLLILDNLEQLLVEDAEAIELISDILEQAPALKLLVTSREQLDLRQEHIFDIDGLPYPEKDSIGLETAVQYSAVALFMDHANRASRHFNPDQEEARAIISLCRLLEGMPLGLEMAAAWVRRDGVRQILSQLQQSFAGLETTWRNVPQRHRSLRAVFDHSWRLLTAEEQTGFARLAVFRSGFSAEAAQTVAGVATPFLYQGKSLLRQPNKGRYDMHSLIHQFTAEMLQKDAGEYEAVRSSHARYYLQLLQDQESSFVGGSVEAALTLVDTEIENVRQAWHWALAHLDLDLLNKGYLSLYLYFETRGSFEEGEAHFRQTTETLERELGPVNSLPDDMALVFGRLLSRAGWFAYRDGQLIRGKAIAQTSVDVFRRLNAPKELAQSLNDLGVLTRRVGDYEQAKALLSESLAIRREIENERDIASSLNNLANAVRIMGEYDQAKTYLLESLGLLDKQHDLILMANATNDLGEIARATGNIDEARRYYEESLAVRQKLGTPHGIAMCLNNLGSLAHTQGDYPSAARYAGESLKLFVDTGNKRAATYPLSILARIARDEADFPAAFSFFRRALQICHEISYLPKSLDILFELATVYEAMAQPAPAIRLLSLVINHPKINHETKQAAQELQDRLETDLAPETAEQRQSQGREDTLDKVITAVLRNEFTPD